MTAGLASSSSLRRRRSMANARNWPTAVITPAMAAATLDRQDVPVVDVHQLVAQHAAQLPLVEQPQDAFRAQTAAFWGLRPVAKALGAVVGHM